MAKIVEYYSLSVDGKVYFTGSQAQCDRMFCLLCDVFNALGIFGEHSICVSYVPKYKPLVPF